MSGDISQQLVTDMFRDRLECTGLDSVTECALGFMTHISRSLHVRVMIIEYTRSVKEFQQCLQAEPLLQDCQKQLLLAGHNFNFGLDGPKVFLEPALVASTTEKLRTHGAMLNNIRVYWDDLKSRHVVVSEAHYHSVKAAVDGLQKSLRIKVKDEALLDVYCDMDMVLTGDEPVENLKDVAEVHLVSLCDLLNRGWLEYEPGRVMKWFINACYH